MGWAGEWLDRGGGVLLEAQDSVENITRVSTLACLFLVKPEITYPKLY